MGVVVPKISSESVQKKMYERGYGIIGTSAAIDEAAESYENWWTRSSWRQRSRLA